MLPLLTDFADQAVVLPLVVAVAATLLISGWKRGALAWLITAGATLGLMLILKLACIACGPPQLRTPSGHTAAAAIVAGSLAALLWPPGRSHAAAMAGLLA